MSARAPSLFSSSLRAFRSVFVSVQKSLPERDRGLYVLDPLLSQLPPLAVNRAVEDLADQFRPVVLFHLTAESSGQRPFVTVHHFFEHPGGRHARQIGSSGRRRQRQRQPDEVVDGISDDGLIEIAN